MLIRQTAPVTKPASYGPVRGFDLPQIALRRRANEHPMALFGVIVSATFACMLLIPGQGPAAAAISGQPARPLVDIRTSDKTERLTAGDVERACHGQAWGSESLDCLLMIAKSEGKAEGALRMVASVEPDRTTPNVF